MPTRSRTRRHTVAPAAIGSQPARSAASVTQARERWRVDAGESDIATLDIPGALVRTRRLRFVVRAPLDVRDAWLELGVEVDGRRQWSRRIATTLPGETDGLEYRCSVELPPGPGLRVRALTSVRGAVRRRLVIEADEQTD